MKTDIEKHICPYSGIEFVPKRSNQKFATRENQIKFNNQKALQKRTAKKVPDRFLSNNREILERILGNHYSIEKSYDFLHGAGLHFGYYTHQINKDDLKWICVYDYAYAHLGNNLFRISHISIK